MGIISIEKTNHLFWLGRYCERVFTTLKVFRKYYDTMIDGSQSDYQIFCLTKQTYHRIKIYLKHPQLLTIFYR